MHSYFYDQSERPAIGRPSRPAMQIRRKGKRRPTLWFAVFLILIAGAVSLAVYLGIRQGLPQEPGAPAQPTVSWNSTSETTIERAPTGDGTVLFLHPQPMVAPLSYQEIYRKNAPAIVFITATGNEGVLLGTGIVMSQDGYVLTNAHVISGCYRVDVTLESGSEYKALLVGLDEESDLAVLKVDAENLIPAEFGDSASLQVGDKALAIGNPLGEEFRGTMTDGIISAINRDVMLEDRNMVLIQTTAALNSGNSGGALINEWGQVVGITNLKISSMFESIEGLGFAIPTGTAKLIVDSLIADGNVTGRPTIGITVRALTAEAAAEYGAGTPPGLRVEEIDENSNAWAQGLRAGDVVVAADGISVLSAQELNEIKNQHAPGDTLRLKVWRDGVNLELDVRLMERYELYA